MRDLPDDPVYVHSRREAAVTLGLWLVCGLYSITYCYLNGYGESSEPVQTIWGIPAWVFWGVLLPWFLVNLFAVWFCLFYIRDEDLGESPGAPDREREHGSG